MRRITALLAALVLALALSGCQAQRAADFRDLGWQALEQDDNHAAAAAFERAIKLDATSDDYLGRGIAYDLLGDVDRALESFNQAIALDNTSAEAYYRRGSLMGSQGNYAQALADFGAATRLDPGYAPAYLSRGCTFVELGSFRRAREDLLRARSLTDDPVLLRQIDAALQALP